jgi:hypothetical protein
VVLADQAHRGTPTLDPGGDVTQAELENLGSGFFFVTVSSVSVITAPFLLNPAGVSDQCRKHL